MLKLFALLAVLSGLAVAGIIPAEDALFTRDTTQHHKRATCNVVSAGTSSKDDTPAIIAALKSCGNGSIIRLAAGKTFMIRTMLDFTGCNNCELQIEGILKGAKG
jgi:galacturan 1,4-alpha-galacturonidase